MAQCLIKGCNQQVANDQVTGGLCAQHTAQFTKVVTNRHAFSVKIGPKGGMTIQLGYRRFPFTFYKLEFEELVKRMPELEAFYKVNKSHMSDKE